MGFCGISFGVLIIKVNTMKKLTTILLLSILTYTGWTQKSPTGKWELSELTGAAKPLKEIFRNKMPTLMIDAANTHFSGNNGCNQIHGNLRIKKDTLRFDSNMASTMMACPGRGEQYFNATLFDVNRYVISNHELIFYKDQKELMRFRSIK